MIGNTRQQGGREMNLQHYTVRKPVAPYRLTDPGLAEVVRAVSNELDIAVNEIISHRDLTYERRYARALVMVVASEHRVVANEQLQLEFVCSQKDIREACGMLESDLVFWQAAHMVWQALSPTLAEA
jgi:hypothetical protein